MEQIVQKLAALSVKVRTPFAIAGLIISLCSGRDQADLPQATAVSPLMVSVQRSIAGTRFLASSFTAE